MVSTRRAFLLGACGGALALARPGLALRRRPQAGRTLVLVQLTGGNDGLSTLIPYGDDAYGRARSTTRIAGDGVLALDPRVGLHPRLARLHEIYQEGCLALIEGVGYPQPNRSHFTSLEIWHSADRRGRSAGDGWVARACRAASLDEDGAVRVVHVGTEPPYSLYSSARPPVSFHTAESYAWVGEEPELLQRAPETAVEPPTTPRTSLEYLRGVHRQARESSTAIREAVRRHRPQAEYPSSPFAGDLLAAAALIHAGLGLRVVSVELKGFDTHGDQRNRHDRLLSELDGALAAFHRDLQSSEAGRDTLVLCFSEFGRRLAENGSRGTDHGAAGLALALGTRVRGGLFGAPPTLTELDDGDPIHTTDFRSVYATVVQHCFGIAPESVLGEGYPPLGFA